MSTGYLTFRLYNEKLISDMTQYANTDFLTGLFNRRAILEKSQMVFDQHKRYQKPLTVIMIDIDRFKKLNDNHGHTIGDLIIKEIAELAKNVIRNDHSIGRLGEMNF